MANAHYSNKRKAIARQEKLEPRQLAVADLMAWGWKAEDAVMALGLVNEESDEAVQTAAAFSFTANPDVDKLVKKRIKQLRAGAVVDKNQAIHPAPGTPRASLGRKRADGTRSWEKPPSDTPATDAEVLAKMWETIEALPKDDPKRATLLDTYDKTKRRQGQDDGDNTTIHMYLPMPVCDTCPFRDRRVISDPTVEHVEGRPADRKTPTPGTQQHDDTPDRRSQSDTADAEQEAQTDNAYYIDPQEVEIIDIF